MAQGAADYTKEYRGTVWDAWDGAVRLPVDSTSATIRAGDLVTVNASSNAVKLTGTAGSLFGTLSDKIFGIALGDESRDPVYNSGKIGRYVVVAPLDDGEVVLKAYDDTNDVPIETNLGVGKAVSLYYSTTAYGNAVGIAAAGATTHATVIEYLGKGWHRVRIDADKRN